MELPKFLIADNSDFADDLFVIHTEYPRFILNVANDDVHWMEEFEAQDERDLKYESENLIEEAFSFFDREIDKMD